MADERLKPPANAARRSLDPKGVAPQIENYAECRAHLIARLHEQVVLVLLKIRTSLSAPFFVSTTTVFVTPADVALL